MAIAKCADCGKDVSTEAKKCPHCGRPLKSFITIGRVLFVALVVLIGLALNMQRRAVDRDAAQTAEFERVLGNLRGTNTDSLDAIYKKVSADSITQYNIAKRQGDLMQICTQAGLVTAALLQEQNETEYNKWKDIEKMDCRRAGMPD